MTKLWEYCESRKDECQELGLDADWRLGEPDPSDPDHLCAMVDARIRLTDNAIVDVIERVVVRGGGVHRERYAYFLAIDNEEVGGYERDPTHTPAEHRHCGKDHVREDHPAISFKEALMQAWEYVSAYASGSTTPEC